MVLQSDLSILSMQFAERSHQASISLSLSGDIFYAILHHGTFFYLLMIHYFLKVDEAQRESDELDRECKHLEIRIDKIKCARSNAYNNAS